MKAQSMATKIVFKDLQYSFCVSFLYVCIFTLSGIRRIGLDTRHGESISTPCLIVNLVVEWVKKNQQLEKWELS